MQHEERIEKLDEKKYQEVFGVKKRTFDCMLKILEEDYQRKHERGGRKPKLSVLDKLVIMLQYYREYRTMENIAFDYGVQKSTIYDAVAWVEETLIKSGQFRLPSKRKLLKQDPSLEVVIVDATECEIERPKKTEKVLFRKKEKTHPEITNHCRRTNAGCHLYHNSSRKKA